MIVVCHNLAVGLLRRLDEAQSHLITRLLVTPSFARAVKRLHRKQKAALDDVVRTIASQPESGEAKVGDLAGLRV